MVSAKRWWIALMVVALLLAGSMAAWVYYINPSPKAPARARQVMATEREEGAIHWNSTATKNING